MVWNTARRFLAQAADADDVFQATFLVLARQAKSLLKHPCLAGWLHETTCHLRSEQIAETHFFHCEDCGSPLFTLGFLVRCEVSLREACKM